MTDNRINEILDNYTIVIYDGICGFCNASIHFILKQNPSKKLRFIAFQSEVGQQIKTVLNIDEPMDSIIVVEKHQYFKKSEAIFTVLNHVGSFWKHLRIFRIVPSFISNFVYDIVARNRYRIQQNDSCRLLTPEEAELFI